MESVELHLKGLHGLKRMIIINNMIVNRKYPTKQEILNKFDELELPLSDSGLEKTLRAMRERFNIPIEYHNLKRGYFYGFVNKNKFGETIYEEIELDIIDEFKRI